VFVDVKLTPRNDVPQWLVYATPVLTIIGALATSSIALFALDVNPLAAYRVMFLDTMLNPFGIRQTLLKSVPLILAGLAVYLPLKAQLWNIGAEGQLFMGAIVGTWIGLNVSVPAFLLLPLMFVGAAIAGGLWAAIPAFLRVKWGINEIITTLLLTFVAANNLSYIVRGPMQASQGNFPQTAVLPTAGQMPVIPVINLHIGTLLAILGVLGTYYFLNRTRFGFEITFIGANADAADHAGMSKAKIYLFVLVCGGIFAAFAGLTEIAGNQGRLRAAFSPGYGFTAIPIALLGRNSAINVAVAGLFFALLFVGGSSLSIALGVPAALIEIIQALIILFLITSEFFKRYRVDISTAPKLEATSAEPTRGEK